MFAWGEAEVGIDIEKITPADDGVIQYCFSEKENQFINEVSGVERDRRFTQIWTLKESYVKCLGIGLSDALKNISIGPDEQHIPYSDEDGSRIKLFFSSSVFHSDFFLSVCGEKEGIEVRELAVKELLQDMISCQKSQL